MTQNLEAEVFGTRHNLDHASTTPLRPAARVAMVDALDHAWADPSRMHHEALVARARLEDARDRVAAALGARSREVIFTSGATESIVAACWGGSGRGSDQVMTAVEHSAVRLAVERAGDSRVVGVDGSGRVDVDELVGTVTAETGMVHCQWVNHEVGVCQPVAEVADALAEMGRGGPLLHVDAAQAIGRVPFAFGHSGFDLVSISGHKFGGPYGTGVLLVRRGVRVDPLLVGGDQERARRAGVENLVGAVGLAAAVDAIDVNAEAAAQREFTAGLRSHLEAVDGVTVHTDPDHASPHLVCAGIADIEPQAVLLGLDRAGIAAHSGSACASEALEPSPVLAAMGVDASHSLRVSVGWTSTTDDVDAFGAAFADVVAELRSLR